MRELSDIIYHSSPLQLLPTVTVKDACRQMHERSVGSVLVTDEQGRLCGIFTGRDVVHRVVASGRDAARTALRDVMTGNPVTIKPQNTAIEALRLMWDGGFRHLPVLEDERVAGVVSRGDFSGAERERLEQERELWEHMR